MAHSTESTVPYSARHLPLTCPTMPPLASFLGMPQHTRHDTDPRPAQQQHRTYKSVTPHTTLSTTGNTVVCAAVPMQKRNPSSPCIAHSRVVAANIDRHHNAVQVSTHFTPYHISSICTTHVYLSYSTPILLIRTSLDPAYIYAGTPHGVSMPGVHHSCGCSRPFRTPRPRFPRTSSVRSEPRVIAHDEH